MLYVLFIFSLHFIFKQIVYLKTLYNLNDKTTTSVMNALINKIELEKNINLMSDENNKFITEIRLNLCTLLKEKDNISKHERGIKII